MQETKLQFEGNQIIYLYFRQSIENIVSADPFPKQSRVPVHL